MRLLQSWVLAFVGLTVGLSHAQAEIVVAESLEWRIDTSQRVALEHHATDNTRRITVPCEDLRALSGQERAALLPEEPPAGIEEVLVFYRPDIHGKVGAHFRINLARPAQRGWDRAAIRMDFTLLKERAQVLAVLRERLGRAPDTPAREGASAANLFQPQTGFLRLEIPYDSEAFMAVWSGSACYLVVPVDPRLEAGFIQTLESSEDPWIRAGAALRLVNFPTEANVARLRGGLKDPGTAVIKQIVDGEERATTCHPVRQACYEALVQLGHKVEKPEGFNEDLPRFWLER